jgi:hypothetical protein
MLNLIEKLDYIHSKIIMKLRKVAKINLFK